MTVHVYRSTDSGAPSLTGSGLGSLINVLAWCLVTGSSSPAGWTKPYTGTNIAIFKQPSTANQRYLYITEASANQYAYMTGLETASSISVYSGQFPSSGQNSGAVNIPRSSTYDATARPWILVATDKIFYLWINGSSSVPVTVLSNTFSMCFGDFISIVPGDTYNTILIAYNTATITPSNTQGGLSCINTSLQTLSPGGYVARNYTQIGSSINVSRSNNFAFAAAANSSGALGMPFPNPADGNIYVSQFYIGENVGTSSGIYRGYLPGIWNLLHNITSLSDGDQITNIAGLTGKTMEVHFTYAGGAASGFLLEISNTW